MTEVPEGTNDTCEVIEDSQKDELMPGMPSVQATSECADISADIIWSDDESYRPMEVDAQGTLRKHKVIAKDCRKHEFIAKQIPFKETLTTPTALGVCTNIT